MEDLPADMQGSKNPLILRNYRVIGPMGWKHINLIPGTGGISLGPGPTYTSDFQLVFKIEAAPVILSYESELIFRIRVPLEAEGESDDYPKATANFNDSGNLRKIVRAGLINGIQSRVPLYRLKLKSASQMIKRAWCTMSNMTFQSVNTPQYLNEILLRKPIEDQRKKPDNYTGEYCIYRTCCDPAVSGSNPATKTVGENPSSIYDLMGNQGLSWTAENSGISLGERGTGWSQWDNVSFSTPYWDETSSEIVIDFRIPLTEILPVFKIGVIPMMMIGSPTIDLIVDFYHPRTWFISRFFSSPSRAECWLNISTVSFPDINPLAAMLIEPRLIGDRFLVPYLDYFTVENTFEVFGNYNRTDFVFNILQFFRNVPFISLSFLDETTKAFVDPRLFDKYSSNLDQPFLSVNGMAQFPVNQLYDDKYSTITERSVFEFDPKNSTTTSTITATATEQGKGTVVNTTAPEGPSAIIPGWSAVYPVTDMADYNWGLNPDERRRGGFYCVPPQVEVTDLKIMLGESAFPLTQLPIDTNSLYMYNRKHFEMYGRNFNVTRVSPLSREKQGDASYFFDISHGPFSGFTIDSDSPLQIVGTFVSNRTDIVRIRVILTIWYSNSFNVLRASGGVVPLQ